LEDERGKAAVDYLLGRGFTKETLQTFGVGFAPDGWDFLDRVGLTKTYDQTTLLDAGLIKKGDRGGCYDVLRNRVVFPIRDEQGRPIAFGGRVLPGDDSPAKYLNSPETPLFNKSGVLFGLDVAKKEMAKSRTAVVFEGYADAAMAYQHGLTNAVAVLGTALTPEHARVLRRLADRVVLVFDADTAGEAATRRSVELFLSEPIEVVVAELPGGVDPDEYLQEHGVEAFHEVLASAKDALAYLWRRLTRRLGEGVTGRQRAVEEYLQLVGEARKNAEVDDVRWGAVVLELAKHTGSTAEELQRRMHRPPPRRDRQVVRAEPPRVDDATRRTGANLLGALFLEPSLWHGAQVRVSPEDFLDRRQRWAADQFWSHLRDEGEPSFAEWLDLIAEAARSGAGGEASAEAARTACIEWSDAAQELGEPATTAANAVREIEQLRARRDRDERAAAARRTDGEGDDAVEALRRLEQKLRGGTA
jgi:DNA primase